MGSRDAQHNLIRKSSIVDYLTREAPWSASHGADGDYLGMGLFYYSIVYTLKAKVAVCLGSGGGFVPRMMRQAQRDLGMAETSRTILVDADNPAAGWGSPQWMSEDSFFRQHFPDIELLIDLTSHAQQFFDDHGVAIDYLHIDADHSFSGCLADFENYRRFLHEGSIVTLHDTNFGGAGVKGVVEHIRTLPDCEVIDLRDIGAGTALVRIGKAGPSWSHSIDATTAANRIQVTRHEDAVPLPEPETEWKYLETEAFATRYVLAAHFVEPCRSVIEIGGAKTPIDLFLTGRHDSVVVVDPFVREHHRTMLNGSPAAVSHVRARFQDVDWHVPPGADYGIVMMGLEIQGLESHHYQTLFQLVSGARVTVIEFPQSWEPSRQQFELIKANTTTKVTAQMKLNLENNDFGDLTNSWPPRCDRTIYVLERSSG